MGRIRHLIWSLCMCMFWGHSFTPVSWYNLLIIILFCNATWMSGQRSSHKCHFSCLRHRSLQFGRETWKHRTSKRESDEALPLLCKIPQTSHRVWSFKDDHFITLNLSNSLRCWKCSIFFFTSLLYSPLPTAEIETASKCLEIPLFYTMCASVSSSWYSSHYVWVISHTWLDVFISNHIISVDKACGCRVLLCRHWFHGSTFRREAALELKPITTPLIW